MGLSTQDQILIEQRLASESKSTFLAYVLWFFTSLVGGHRFYLGFTRTGFAMLSLTVLGVVLSPYGMAGRALLIIVVVWTLADVVLIPRMVQEHKRSLRQKMGTDTLIASAAGLQNIDTRKWSKADRERIAAQAAMEKKEGGP